MFDRAWIENELAGLIIQLHQIEGAIAVLQQMLKQLEEAGSCASSLDLTLDELQDMLPPGHVIEGGIEPL